MVDELIMINHQNEIIHWSNLDLDGLPSNNMALEYEYPLVI